jgi:hypothetical protein
LAPAPIPVGRVIVSKRYVKEREVIESIDKKTSVAEAILKAVAAALTEETSIDEGMPGGEGGADKAVWTWDECAPAGDHAATESATTEPTVEVPATKSTVEATAAESAAAAERHGWRCHEECRHHRGRGKATEQFGIHASDPPYAIPEFSSAPANGKETPRRSRPRPHQAASGI